MEKTKLAIVIPAYKLKYLKLTLESISRQTNKNFNLYIGDDCSPDNLYENVIKDYEDKINLYYHKFNYNLGGKDLVSHWERCINLTQGEEYIWLFSDDDIMDENCVEEFYSNIKRDDDILRFDVRIINSQNEIIGVESFPDYLSAENLYVDKIKFKRNCFVVEFIFSRKIYEETSHFPRFDLAWGSDLAAWVNMGFSKGIKSIHNAKISWRSSEINISSITSPEILERKASALVDFFKWGLNRFPDSKRVRKINRIGFVKRLVRMSKESGINLYIDPIRKYSNNNHDYLAILFIYHLYYYLNILRNVFQRIKTQG